MNIPLLDHEKRGVLEKQEQQAQESDVFSWDGIPWFLQDMWR